MKIRLIIFTLIILAIFSCKKDTGDNEQAIIDEEIILDYLADNNLEAIPTGSGLYYQIITEGEGEEHPNVNSYINIYYKGYLTNGYVFDKGSSSFSLRNLIEGWKEGIPLMKKDGVARLFIPSKLGYGANAQIGIPANSVLIFDIHLINF